ncbi:MAG: hypothetical protein FJ096_18300 [Deltaproteobacteria bacterium]|nr:hypothetical protein [Deltaproteobacteria bacterium]
MPEGRTSRRSDGGRARFAAIAHGVLLATSSTACLELPRPREAASTLEPRDVKATSLSIDTACVPSGVERCFDALDDNCNGIIDEGCGLQTGLLQFTIAWTEPADVDLRVTGPDGAVAEAAQPTRSGLLLERDCKGTTDCHGQNVENVYLAEGWPRRGRYVVTVRLSDPREAALPVRVRFSARVGQRVLTGIALLEEPKDEKSFELTL